MNGIKHVDHSFDPAEPLYNVMWMDVATHHSKLHIANVERALRMRTAIAPLSAFARRTSCHEPFNFDVGFEATTSQKFVSVAGRFRSAFFFLPLSARSCHGGGGSRNLFSAFFVWLQLVALCHFETFADRRAGKKSFVVFRSVVRAFCTPRHCLEQWIWHG